MDWNAFRNALLGQKLKKVVEKQEVIEVEKQEETVFIPQDIEERYEDYCDKHIIEEPAYVETVEDAVLAAKMTDEHFDSIPGELPDGKSVRPEEDAVYTEEEIEALKKKHETETKVKAVTVKKTTAAAKKTTAKKAATKKTATKKTSKTEK